MKIALAQINPTVGDFTGNTQKILEYAARAAEQAADLVVFPELCVCGYPPADFLDKTVFLNRAVQAVNEIAAWTAPAGRPALIVGSVMPAASSVGKHVSNVAVLLSGGRVQFIQQKMLLPFYDVFDEQRYFEPATSQSLTFVGDQPVAITICEDAWNDKDFWPRQLYPLDPVDSLMRQWQADSAQLDQHPRLIINISASPFCEGKPAVRERMLSAIASSHKAFVLLVNQVGGNDGLVFDGSSLLLDPSGTVVARGACFAEDLVVVDFPKRIFLRKLCRKFSGSFAEHQKVRKRITAEPVRAIDSGRAFTSGEQPRHIGHLGICVHMHATHDVMRGRPNFHRLLGNVDVA